MKHFSTLIKLSVLVASLALFSCQKGKQATHKTKQVKTEKKEAVATKPQAPKPEIKPKAPINKYFLITASFQNPQNAEKLHKQLKDKGYDASILSASNGYYRVSYKGFSQRNIAFKELRSARATAEHSDVWLHIKN